MRILSTLCLWLCTSVVSGADFENYQEAISGSVESISMVALAGGSFTMGSPTDEQGRETSEGPLREVHVDDFWMAKYEITWQQYDLFVDRDEHFSQFQDDALPGLAIAADGVTGATVPYVEMSFGMGKEGFPAVNMTHYAALHYARWLSAKTGQFYRLPTEAEWEYACRAGTRTPFSFAAGTLSDYAVFNGNSDGRYEKTGSRQPNPWGLHDMHGNVAEWTMDQFNPRWYGNAPDANPWNRPEELYPRTARGGSWIDPPQRLRCAARLPSAAEWKERDPQIPRSQWWLTNAPFVGFRLVRPRIQPDAREIQRYWLEAIEDYGI